MSFEKYARKQLNSTDDASHSNVEHASSFAEALHNIIDEMDEVECEKVYQRLRYNDILGYEMAPKPTPEELRKINSETTHDMYFMGHILSIHIDRQQKELAA